MPALRSPRRPRVPSTPALLAFVALLASSAAAHAAAAPVLSFSGIERLDGRPGAEAATSVRWRQALDELRRARGGPATWPDPRAAGFAAGARPGEIRLGLVDLGYALDPAAPKGTTVLAPGNGPQRVFAFAPLDPRTYRGAGLRVRLDPDYLVTDWRGAPPRLELDAGEGLGFRPIAPGAAVPVAYATPGDRLLRLRVTEADGTRREAAATLAVGALGTPTPDDTLYATGAPWQGVSATGLGYVYLAPGHAAPVNPVLVPEGFDLDNSLAWDGLYALLNRENLLEDLRADGFDLVVLDFSDATDAIQRNAFVLVDLIEQVRATLPPGGTMAMVGPSMGGLVGRYALAWMESQALPHDVRTFISFDAPQRGADIPLGVQYWFEFFADQAPEVAALRNVLNSPASRQMLVYHYTVPASSGGAPDPQKIALDAELATLGYPQLCRIVAASNGSGMGLSQGFEPGDQLVQWDYTLPLLATIHGNVWAVPNGTPTQIFQGRLYSLIPPNNLTLNVTVSGTAPYDGAPGGSRNSMQQMDDSPAPYGDIIALHGSHCFIPTVSALDFDTADLFHDVLGDPDPLASTPFAAIYVPDSNQVHIDITPENAAWLRGEIANGLVGVPPAQLAAGVALAASPNPFGTTARIRYTLPVAGEARVEVYGIDGRRVATLASGVHSAGSHAAAWDGRDGAGARAPAGIYFVRLAAPGASRTVRIARVP